MGVLREGHRGRAEVGRVDDPSAGPVGHDRVGESRARDPNRGYDHWCASIGGEDNLLLAVPRGKKLVFQAVVTAEGVTVERNWPMIVR